MNTLLSLYEKQLQISQPGSAVLTVVDSHLEPVSYDMPALDQMIRRAASCLKAQGCEKGDRILISVRETIPVWAFFWGALRLGAVPAVLFPGLGSGALEVRLKAADACYLVTDADPAKISDNICFPDTLKKVILTGKSSGEKNFVHWQQEDLLLWDGAAAVDPDDNAFIVFTSGTTGKPKPVVHRHAIADPIVKSMRNILHAGPEDVYWCTAHPAWITGTVYGIIGPLLCGIRSIQYEGNFHAKRWMPILQDQKVSLWYTAPTALRALMREEKGFFSGYDFSALKQIYSIGEPLSAKVYEWGSEIFHQPVYDTWFQTECGTVRIANQPGIPLTPGRMGLPIDDTEIVPGEDIPHEAVRTAGRDADIRRLYLKAGFASMFREYYKMPAETAEKTKDGLFDTGDMVSVGADGTIRFEGRADEVINTSGHLVGPMEVEQVLVSDPAVLSAAVVGEPDDLLYEAPAAFLVLAEGQEWSKPLETRLKVAVNNNVSAYAVPKKFYLVGEIPLTMSGKINRAELKNRFFPG